MGEQGAIPKQLIEDDTTKPLFSNATTLEIPAIPEHVEKTARKEGDNADLRNDF